MKLVDIKGNINPKQRLILIITILLLLIVIFGILKSVTKKNEGIDLEIFFVQLAPQVLE